MLNATQSCRFTPTHPEAAGEPPLLLCPTEADGPDGVRGVSIDSDGSVIWLALADIDRLAEALRTCA